jgi:mannose-6-phosphate isomerase-like protein (cupin superfamily)
MPVTLPPLVRTPDEGRQVTVRRARITFTATAADTGGRFELYGITLAPDEAPLVRHVHLQMDELVHVTSGELDAIIGDRRLRAREGTTFFIPRGVPHAYANRGPGPAAFLQHFSPSGHREQYYERLARLTGGTLPPTDAQLAELGRCFDEVPVPD